MEALTLLPILLPILALLVICFLRLVSIQDELRDLAVLVRNQTRPRRNKVTRRKP